MKPEAELVLDALHAAGVLTDEQHERAVATLKDLIAAQWGGAQTIA